MAVYTEVSDGELARFLADYDIGRLTSFAGIAEGIENSNFLVRTTAGTYVLTLYEKRVARADLPFFVRLMDHLAARGIRCPVPVKGRDGDALRELNGRPACIVTFLEGLWPRRVQPFHCAAVGRALAELHEAGRSFAMRRDNDLSLDGWRRLAAATRDRADTVKPGLARAIDDELDWLGAGWPAGLPEGVIHADLFPDNVFFLGEALSGLIDFYFACTDLLAYDVAVCLNAWCFEPDGSFNLTKGKALLTGYAARRALAAEEVAALPTLCRGSALRFLMTRLYDWLNPAEGALVRPKSPLEYVRKLAFHQQARSAVAYGL